MSSKRFMTCAVMAALLAAPAGGADVGAETFRAATLGYAWDFPADHWSHPGYEVEWWYFTGHLQSVEAPARRFGFQYTLFRVGLTPSAPAADSDWSAANLMMGHASITDKDRKTHRFSELLYREVPFLASFSRAPSGASRGVGVRSVPLRTGPSTGTARPSTSP